jgi:hypothetical protein
MKLSLPAIRSGLLPIAAALMLPVRVRRKNGLRGRFTEAFPLE